LYLHFYFNSQSSQVHKVITTIRQVVHYDLINFFLFKKSPDEYAFTSPLPEPILPPLQYDEFLYRNEINVNRVIMDMYIKYILPVICKEEDDNNYGSSATKDIEALQALSKRIHFGKSMQKKISASIPQLLQ
jgi:chorismate mutase